MARTGGLSLSQVVWSPSCSGDNLFRNLRHIFERVVAACMVAGLVKGEGFAVDASLMEANASRYHGKAPNELNWTDAQRQKRAVAEYLAGLEAEAQDQEEGITVAAYDGA